MSEREPYSLDLWHYESKIWKKTTFVNGKLPKVLYYRQSYLYDFHLWNAKTTSLLRPIFIKILLLAIL